MYCDLCGKPTTPNIQLALTVHINNSVSNRWGGGRGHGRIALCEDCMWNLDAIACEAIRLEIEMRRSMHFSTMSREEGEE